MNLTICQKLLVVKAMWESRVLGRGNQCQNRPTQNHSFQGYFMKIPGGGFLKKWVRVRLGVVTGLR